MKKLNILSNLFLAVVLVGQALFVNAQKAEMPDDTYDLGVKINDMTITEGGTVVVATDDGLVGIKPNNKTLLFNFTDYGRVKPEEMQFIPLSPYVMIGQTGFANLSSKKAVIDYMSGKILFTTESKGWKIFLHVMLLCHRISSWSVVFKRVAEKPRVVRQKSLFMI